VAGEPVPGQPGGGIEGARLLEQVGGAGHHGQVVLAAQLGLGPAVCRNWCAGRWVAADQRLSGGAAAGDGSQQLGALVFLDRPHVPVRVFEEAVA
jgi:hypothetical protein